MLLRTVLLLALVWLLWTLWRKAQPRRPDAAPPPPPGPAAPEAMRSCAECGVHLPQSLAYPGRGGVFCSPEHRDRFESRPPP